MPLFSKVFKSKDANKKLTTSNVNGNAVAKPQWVDSWLRTRVDPEEVAELLHGCTQEIKSRALNIPFLLLPFRPSSDPSAARTFVRNYFIPLKDRPKLKGDALVNELKMAEVMVLISVMKWCWARLPGGVVSWETYKMFAIGEKDSKYARNAYHTFIPISVESNARVSIINDFFDLLASLAAHGKSNGLGGFKVSRYAGWWAFEHYDTGKGFEAGYKAWSKAADATCHLFFAYLRSLSPEPGKNNGILGLPRSLHQLVEATAYPPVSSLLSNDTTKVVMVVDVVSPTPYALLRRAKNFEYRDDDEALQRFSDYDDPVEVLTDECRRVLRAISNTNQSNVSDSKTSTSLVDPSWSRFEDIGFSSALEEIGEDEKSGMFNFSAPSPQGLSTTARSPVMDLDRPTTPSWADFLSSGFPDENGQRATSLLPPDKMLPPINTEPRGQSSQSHRRAFESGSALEPGELASITKINIDDSFWWVWISSLAGEEPTSRKACFGRCALIETKIPGGHWMVMEEQVKGAAPEPIQGTYIAEKKGFLGFTTKRGRLTRRKSAVKKSPLSPNGLAKSDYDPTNSATLAPDQQAKIQKAAMELANKKRSEEVVKIGHNRRGRFDDTESRSNSIFTLGPHIKAEVSPALAWAKQYDKNAIRAQYLGNSLAGKGSTDFLNLPTNGIAPTQSVSTLSETLKEKDLPNVPSETESISEPAAVTIIPAESSEQRAAVASANPVSETGTNPTPAPIPTVIEPTPLPLQSAAPLSAEPSIEEAAIITLPPPPAPEPEKVEVSPEVEDQQTSNRPPSTIGSKQSKASSPEQSRKSMQGDSPLAQRPNGIKRLFGTIRKNKDEQPAPRPAPVANPAVAAARRALESKINPSHPAPVQPNYAKYKGVRTPIAATTPVAPVPEPVQETAPELPSESTTETAPEPAPVIEPATIEVATLPEPETRPESELEPQSMPAAIKKTLAPSPNLDDFEYQPPRTRRDEEFDNLSRVDTKEREHADKEFSKFDQGPLLDQPVALPDDYPSHNGVHGEADIQTKHQSVYSAVTMDPESTDDEVLEEGEQSDPAQEVNANDRWAQIRRNAAERAGRFSDDRGSRSRAETKTDDGETSGEETIESRVARIKARVAELTGNMEGVRR